MIALKYPSTKDMVTDYHFLKRKDLCSDFWVRAITDTYQDEIPAINSVEIETINRCNNDCSFCPVNCNDDTRPHKVMTKELFEKIINELVDINYEGYLSIFSNNEPLLDVRLYDFIQYAKEKLPKATHCLYTNGTLLDEEKYLKLTKYLDYLVIDNYDDDLNLLANVAPIVEKYKDEPSTCKVSVLMRKKNQVLLTRGGVAPNREMVSRFVSSCILPFMQLVIRPDGEISRCCQDALAKTTLGDVSKNTISEVWSNEEYQEFRQLISQHGRNSVDFCKNCDSFGIMNYFPEFWTKIVVQALIDYVWKQKLSGKKIYVFEDNKITREVTNLLAANGLKIDGILYSKDQEQIIDKNSFTIFSSTEYKILDEIDYDFKLLNKKYIVYEGVNHSLHTEFFDEDENKEVKEFIRFIDTIRNKKTIVFGTGFTSMKVNSVYDMDIAYYIDNNEKKSGTTFEGKKVWLPKKLEEENIDDICVVVASVHYNAMKQQLVENHWCKEENVLEGLRYLD